MRSINQTTMPRLVASNGDELKLVAQNGDELVVVERRPPRFMRPKHCEADIGCKRGHINNLINSGVLTRYKLGAMVLISVAEWDAYVATAAAVPVEKPK